MYETLKTIVAGHVKVTDTLTGEVLVDKHNAIHAANMATAIARGLANSANYQIYKLKLGNQGTYINGTGDIIFRPANVLSTTVDPSSDLYNPTYAEIVDEGSTGAGVGNSVAFTNVPSSTSTRVIITAVISSSEAYDNASDTTNSGQIGGISSTTSPYFFDELGLFTKGNAGGTILQDAGELMLSHLIFSPIEHTGNRELTIVYTLTITVS
jgi:hypothetical protein